MQFTASVAADMDHVTVTTDDTMTDKFHLSSSQQLERRRSPGGLSQSSVSHQDDQRHDP